MLPSESLQDEGPDELHALPVEDTAALDGVAKGVRVENVDAETHAPLGGAGAGVLPARPVVHDAREDQLGLVPAREAGLHIARAVVDDDGPLGHGRGRGTGGRPLLNLAPQGCWANKSHLQRERMGFSVSPFWPLWAASHSAPRVKPQAPRSLSVPPSKPLHKPSPEPGMFFPSQTPHHPTRPTQRPIGEHVSMTPGGHVHSTRAEIGP